MAFKSYTATARPEGGWILSSPVPMRFSGPKGLIARHVCAPGYLTNIHWSLSDTFWLGLCPLPDETAPGSRWIIFEQIEDDCPRFSRVLRVNGVIAHGQTELLFTMSPLLSVQSQPTIIVTAPVGGRIWSEELALDGAPDRKNAPWNWCERALHVGAAVLGGRPR
jgi:hypothetical protein